MKKHLRTLLTIGILLLPALTNAYTLQGERSVAFHPYDKQTLYYVADQTLFRTTDAQNWITEDLTVVDYNLSQYNFEINVFDPAFQFVAALNNDTNQYTVFRSRDEGELWVRTYQSGLPSLSPSKINRYDFASLQRNPKRVYFWSHEIDPTTYRTWSTMYESDDYGTTFEELSPEISTAGAESFIMVPHRGRTKKAHSNSVYACVMDKKGTQWEYTWYRAISFDDEFSEKSNYSFPSNYQLIWFDVAPKDEMVFWAVGKNAYGNLGIFYSEERTRIWKQAKTPSDVTLDDNFQINATDSNLLITLSNKIYVFNPRDLDNPTLLDLSSLNLSAVSTTLDELIIEGHPLNAEEMIVSLPPAQKVWYSADAGNTWDDISPYWEARWVEQTAVDSFYNAYLVNPGDKLKVDFVFQNFGNVAWDDWGRNKVGLYVYKDPIYSTPYLYNDPDSGLFGQSYFADLFTWGPSNNGLVPNARAALPSDAPVEAGLNTTFSVTFNIPEDASPNYSYVDDPLTPYNDTYYREDLTVAYGYNWMKNRMNGDPFGNAHIWVPIRVR